MEAATSVSPASTPKSINPAAPSPTAFLKGADSPGSKSQRIDSSGNGESFSSTISFATLASTPPHGSVPTNQPQINSLAVEHAPNVHTSNGAVGTLIVLLFVLGIFFIAGYWASNRSSRWKGLRWTRYPESKWTPLSLSHGESERNLSLEGGREQTESLNNTAIDHSAVSPTFKTRRDKSNPLQLYLNYRRGCATGSLEEIDEELDSAEQTACSIETAKPTITPGLGPARYRLKTCKWEAGSSDSLHVKSTFNSPTNSNLAGFQKRYCIPHSTTASPGRNTRKASELAGDLDRSSAQVGYEEFGINQHRREPDIHHLTGASYLLTRLKESISRCTKLSNMRSLGRNAQRDERSTKGSGVDCDSEEEFESKAGAAAEDDDASEMRYLVLTSFKRTPTRDVPGERELSLAEIPLPEPPALAWNMSPANDLALINNVQQPRPACDPPSGQIHRAGEISTPSRPNRHREWTLSSRALSPSSSSPPFPETPTRKPHTSNTPNLTDNRTYFATSRLHF